MAKRLLILFYLAASVNLWAYRIDLAEQYYELYHQHFYYYPEEIAENVHYLQMALHSDFANPLNALASIENELQWEKYRYLFYMHVNLELVDCYIKWAGRFDKFDARFFNYPWRAANLDSLDNAEKLYRQALVYWEDAVFWSGEASSDQFAWMFLTDIQNWEDENYRIATGDLDYLDIITAHLERVDRVRNQFLEMDSSTY